MELQQPRIKEKINHNNQTGKAEDGAKPDGTGCSEAPGCMGRAGLREN